MKKRIMAFASAMVLVITMVCVGGLSPVATAETDVVTETNGLYDVYKSGGTYGMEAVSSTNAELKTNGADTDAIGGDYGIGIGGNRPGQTTNSFIVSNNDPRISDLVNAAYTAATKGEAEGYAGTLSYGGYVLYDNVHTTDGNAGVDFGATIEMETNLLNFNLYFLANNKNTSEFTITAQVSPDKETWRDLPLEQAYHKQERGWLSGNSVAVCSPAENQLRTDDKYVKFTYKAPGKKSGWAYSLNKVEWVCQDTVVYKDAITMETVKANGADQWLEYAGKAEDATSNFFIQTNGAAHPEQSPYLNNMRKAAAGTAYATFKSADEDVSTVELSYATTVPHTVSVSLAATEDGFDGGDAVTLTVSQEQTSEVTGNNWKSYDVTAVAEDIPRGMCYVRITFTPVNDDSTGFASTALNFYRYQLGIKPPTLVGDMSYEHFTAEEYYLNDDREGWIERYKYNPKEAWYGEDANADLTALVESSNLAVWIDNNYDAEDPNYYGASPSSYNIRKYSGENRDGWDAYATFYSSEDIYDVVFYTTQAYRQQVQISVAESLSDFGGENEHVLRTVNTLVENAWAPRYEVSVANGEEIPAGMKFVRLYVGVDDTTTEDADWEAYLAGEKETFAFNAFNLYAYDLGHRDAPRYKATVTYRTVNATDFAAQFNMLTEAAEYTTVKAYAAMADREHYFREIELVCSEGTLNDEIKAPALWESFVYTPAGGVDLGDCNYIKLEVSQPITSAIDSVQFMGLSYTANDEDLKVYDHSSLEILPENDPIRRDQYFTSKADVNNGKNMGGYRFYFMNSNIADAKKEEQGFLVYDFESLTNFRVFAAINSAQGTTNTQWADPANVDLRFYVASEDDDSKYVEIKTKYEYGDRTTDTTLDGLDWWHYDNYAYTPVDPADIPEGARYLKVMASQKEAVRLIRFEGDQAPEPVRTASARKVSTDTNDDLVKNGFYNITAKQEQGFRVNQGELGVWIKFKNSYPTFAKATVTFTEELRNELDVYWMYNQQKVDTIVTFLDDTTAQVQMAAKVDAPLASPELQLVVNPFSSAETSEKVVFIKDIIIHESVENAVTVAPAENGTVSVDDELAYDKQTVQVTAEPAEGYVLQDLQVVTASDEKIAVAEDLTFVMPDESVTVTPVFHTKDFAVAKAENDGVRGTFTVSTASAAEGTTVTVTTTANEGYQANAVKVTGTLFGEVEVTKKSTGVYTFILPKDDVTVDVSFGAREVAPGYSAMLGGSIRKDGEEIDGYCGLRFKAMASFDVDENGANTITVDGKKYTVKNFGMLIMRKDRVEKFTDLAVQEGKDGEMTLDNILQSELYLKYVKAKNLQSNETVDGKRTVTYTAVVTKMKDDLDHKYYWVLARPYFECVNENGVPVEFYGAVSQNDIYYVKTQTLINEKHESNENFTDATAWNTQVNEAMLLHNVDAEASEKDWVNLTYEDVKQGSAKVYVPYPKSERQNFDTHTASIMGMRECVEGVDYEIDYENGLIRRLPGSTMINNYYNNQKMYPFEVAYDEADKTGVEYIAPQDSSGYPFAYNDTAFIVYDYINHPEENELLTDYLDSYMEGKAQLSDEFKDLLDSKNENGGTLTYLVIGDSISTGADAYMLDGYDWTYYGRLEAWLEEKYPNLDVDVVNYAVAGRGAADAYDHLRIALEEDGVKPDLISIAFGMNDQANAGSGKSKWCKTCHASAAAALAAEEIFEASYSTCPKCEGKDLGRYYLTNPTEGEEEYNEYINNTKAALDYLTTAAPDAEVMLVSSMPAHPMTTICSLDENMTGQFVADEEGNYPRASSRMASRQYASRLHALGDSDAYNMAVVPVNEAFVYMHDVKEKSWAELIITGGNHPGQYGHGLYFESFKAMFE